MEVSCSSQLYPTKFSGLVNKKPSIPITALRECAARLVAAAACRLFPRLQAVGGGATDSGFYYDFVSDRPFDKAAFPLIQEHIRSLISDPVVFRSHTMIGKIARDLLRHHGQPLLGDSLENEAGLVDVIQIGDFFDVCPVPHIDALSELKATELIDVVSLTREDPVFGEREVVRVVGTTFFREDELKKYLKLIRKTKRKEKRPDVLSEKISLGDSYLEDSFLQDVQQIKDQWRQICHEARIPLVQSPALQNRGFLQAHGIQGFGEGEWIYPYSLLPAHLEYMGAKNILKAGEFWHSVFPLLSHQAVPLFRSRGMTLDQIHTIATSETIVEELISSLHLMNKSLKMLSIDGIWCFNSYGKRSKRNAPLWELAESSLKKAWNQFRLSPLPLDNGSGAGLDPVKFTGPRIECHFVDRLGRKWAGPYIGIAIFKGNDQIVIEQSLFGPVERLIGYLTDKDKA